MRSELSIRNWSSGPTSSLLRVFTTVTTGVMSMPAACMFSIALSLTSNRLVMWRCELDSLVTPSSWKYAMSKPASFAWNANSGSRAKRRPLVAAWTL